MPTWARGSLYTASAPIDVGDETWLYFTGTAERHGWVGAGVDTKEWRDALAGRGGFMRIGLAKWPKDRLIGYRARLRERIELLANERGAGPGKLVLNADVRTGGRLRVALLNGAGEVIPGYGMEESDALIGDQRLTTVRWQGKDQLPELPAGQPLLARIELEDATLFAFAFSA